MHVQASSILLVGNLAYMLVVTCVSQLTRTNLACVMTKKLATVKQRRVRANHLLANVQGAGGGDADGVAAVFAGTDKGVAGAAQVESVVASGCTAGHAYRINMATLVVYVALLHE